MAELTEKVRTIISIICLLIITAGSIVIGYCYNDIREYQHFGRIYNNIDNVSTDCINETFIGKVNCMGNYVGSIFKYTETDDSIELTLEELKERGGDCKDWSELYYKMAKDLDINTRLVSFTMNKTGNTAHQVAIVSDEYGYCILDQEIIRCTNLLDRPRNR